MQKNGGSSVLPFAGSDLVLSPAQWSSHVVGKNYYRLFCCVTFSKFVVLCVGLFECPRIDFDRFNSFYLFYFYPSNILLAIKCPGIYSIYFSPYLSLITNTLAAHIGFLKTFQEKLAPGLTWIQKTRSSGVTLKLP